LEATTATHGNRKVALKISGWINAAILAWQDHGGAIDSRDQAFADRNSGAYVVNNSAAQTRFNIEGVAKVTPDFIAGFSLSLRPWGSKLGDVSQIDSNPSTPSNSSPGNVEVRDTFTFIDARNFGKWQLGEQVSAADSAWYQDLGGSSTWITNMNPGAWNTSFGLRDANGGLTDVAWGGLLQELSDNQAPRLAFYSRQVEGFQAAASVGSQTWALALYYSRQRGSLNVAAGIGYDVSYGEAALSSQLVGRTLVDATSTRLAKLGLSGTVFESKLGLYATAGYSRVAAVLDGRGDATNLYGKLGWRRNVSGLGETNFYGEYDRTSQAYANGVNAQVWGAGVTQDLDATGSVLYAGFRHANLETGIDGANLILTAAQKASGASPTLAAAIPAQSFDAVLAGLAVQF